MKIVRINKGKAVNLPLRLIGVIVATVGTIQLMHILPEPWSVLVTIVVASFVPAIWFSDKVIIIDMDKKEVFDGVWTMGKRLGKATIFNEVEKIFIDKVKTKQTLYNLSNKQNIVVNHEYRAYLELDNGENFFLISHPLEDKLEEKVTKIEKKLGIG